MIWLGIRIDLKSSFYCIPTEKLSAIKNSTVLLTEKLPYTTTRELAKACRKLISTKFILGDIVQLKTRNLHKVIENQLLWLDSKAIKELIFWKNNINFLNKKPLRAYDLPRTVIAPSLQNTSIHLKTDNLATSVITRIGSNKTSLQKFAETINKICIKNSIKFEISWIPCNNNAAADTISKLIDYDDWQTMVKFFQKISET